MKPPLPSVKPELETNLALARYICGDVPLNVVASNAVATAPDLQPSIARQLFVKLRDAGFSRMKGITGTHAGADVVGLFIWIDEVIGGHTERTSKVHLLLGGRALCLKPGVPGEWNDDDRWVRLADRADATCAACLAAADRRTSAAGAGDASAHPDSTDPSCPYCVDHPCPEHQPLSSSEVPR